MKNWLDHVRLIARLDTINPYCVLPPAYEQRYIFMPSDWWILAHRSGSRISRFCWTFCRLNEHAWIGTLCALHQKFFKFVKNVAKAIFHWINGIFCSKFSKTFFIQNPLKSFLSKIELQTSEKNLWIQSIVTKTHNFSLRFWTILKDSLDFITDSNLLSIY